MIRWTLPFPPRRAVPPAAMLMLLMIAAGASHAQVSLRGQAEAVAGEITRVGPEGIVVSVGGLSKTIGWDRVREVHGEHGAEAAKQLDAVGDLWRARMRLERGDFAAAEPMLDALAVKQRGLVGPTPAVVFEGQLRCRLKRGATVGAVWAWLDWVRARGGAIGSATDVSSSWIGGRADAAPVVDAKTGLIIGTPPIFLHDAALDAAVASDEWSRFTSAEPTTAELGMLYRAAARYEADLDPELAPVTGTGEHVRLVADIVQARVGNDQQRELARGSLKARLEQREIEPWVECWCRVGMGRSLIREPDSDMTRQGIIQLLHAPSRFARVSSYAASIAMAEAAVMLHDLGDDQGAAALKTELLDRYGRSNAAGWPRLREIKSVTEAKKSGDAAKADELPPTGKDVKPGTPDGRGG